MGACTSAPASEASPRSDSSQRPSAQRPESPESAASPVAARAARAGGAPKRASVSVRLPDRADRSFEYMELLGGGAFGKVARVRSREDGQQYAMKIIDKAAVREDMGEEFFERLHEEVALLNELSCPYIVGLHFDFENDKMIFLVMELVRGGTLQKLCVDAGARWPEAKARLLAAELVLALEHLHSKGIVYRDMKPDNVLFDEAGRVRLIDLGAAARMPEGGAPLSLEVGAEAFKSPEMLSGLGYGFATDFYSLGALLFQVLTASLPSASRRMTLMPSNGEVQVPGFVGEAAASLLRGLLARDPAARLGGGDAANRAGAAAVKAHAFFAGVDWVSLERGEAPSLLDAPPPPLPANERPSMRSVREVFREFKAQDPESMLQSAF